MRFLVAAIAAVTFCGCFASVDDPNANSLSSRGNDWFEKGEFDKAIQNYDKAIALDPNANRYSSRGLAWHAKGELDKAIQDYDKAIGLAPRKSAEAYLNRGSVWKAKGQFGKAIQDYDKVIELYPKYPYAYNALSWLRATCPDAKHRDGKQAVAHALKLIRVSKGEHGVYDMNTIAAAYAEDGQFDKAIKMQQEAMKLLKTEIEREDYQSRLTLYQQKKPFRDEMK